MADVIDGIVEREAAILTANISAALQNSSNESINPKGSCHYCDEPFGDSTLRFCDKDCADDYQKYINK